MEYTQAQISITSGRMIAGLSRMMLSVGAAEDTLKANVIMFQHLMTTASGAMACELALDSGISGREFDSFATAFLLGSLAADDLARSHLGKAMQEMERLSKALDPKGPDTTDPRMN